MSHLGKDQSTKVMLTAIDGKPVQIDMSRWFKQFSDALVPEPKCATCNRAIMAGGCPYGYVDCPQFGGIARAGR